MAVPPGFFAVRFVYGVGPITLDFDQAATTVFPQITPIMGSSMVYDGHRETLFNRQEYGVTLAWQKLSTTMINGVGTWFNNWGGLGKQTAITLDRAATCAGQAEYDNFNAFFTKAELITAPLSLQIPPLAASRTVIDRAIYSVALVFRQGK